MGCAGAGAASVPMVRNDGGITPIIQHQPKQTYWTNPLTIDIAHRREKKKTKFDQRAGQELSRMGRLPRRIVRSGSSQREYKKEKEKETAQKERKDQEMAASRDARSSDRDGTSKPKFWTFEMAEFGRKAPRHVTWNECGQSDRCRCQACSARDGPASGVEDGGDSEGIGI